MQWSDLSPRTRRIFVIGAGFEASLKVAALSDLVRRPSSEIRGTKPRWAAAIAFINAAGAAPVAYFLFGRRKP